MDKDTYVEKGNALIIAFGGQIPEEVPRIKREVSSVPFELMFNIYIEEMESTEYLLYASQSPCIDISAPEHLSRFKGEVLYRTVYVAEKEYNVLNLGEVGATAQVWLNGQYLGTGINAPYKFEMQGVLQSGKNELEIKMYTAIVNVRILTLAEKISRKCPLA